MSRRPSVRGWTQRRRSRRRNTWHYSVSSHCRLVAMPSQRSVPLLRVTRGDVDRAGTRRLPDDELTAVDVEAVAETLLEHLPLLTHRSRDDGEGIPVAQ